MFERKVLLATPTIYSLVVTAKSISIAPFGFTWSLSPQKCLNLSSFNVFMPKAKSLLLHSPHRSQTTCLFLPLPCRCFTAFILSKKEPRHAEPEVTSPNQRPPWPPWPLPQRRNEPRTTDNRRIWRGKGKKQQLKNPPSSSNHRTEIHRPPCTVHLYLHVALDQVRQGGTPPRPRPAWKSTEKISAPGRSLRMRKK